MNRPLAATMRGLRDAALVLVALLASPAFALHEAPESAPARHISFGGFLEFPDSARNVDSGMGAEVACRLSRQSESSKVMLIGGPDQKHSRSLVNQFDLSGFIEKPFDLPILESALHDVMNLWRPYRLNAQLRRASPWAGVAA